jgi:uncharacterized membrane protein YhaH (DUF805 family)/Tfp pilus assembly major pilin PilA
MTANDTETLRFFSLRGRIGRLRYIAYYAGTLLLCVIPAGIGAALIALHENVIGWSMILLTELFSVVMGVVFDIRRLHDMNASTWWILVVFLQFLFSIVITPLGTLMALVIFIVFASIPGTAGENRFGQPPPQNTGWVTAGVVTLFAGIPFIGVIAAIAIPQYQQYVARAQMMEAFQLASAARHPVHMYYRRNHIWPSDLGSIYAPASKYTDAGRFVDSINGSVSTDGSYMIVVTMKKSERVNFEVRGKALETWSHDGGKSWWCGPVDTNYLIAKDMPAPCRDITTPRP